MEKRGGVALEPGDRVLMRQAKNDAPLHSPLKWRYPAIGRNIYPGIYPFFLGRCEAFQ